MLKKISFLLLLSSLLAACGGDDDDNDKKPASSSSVMSSSPAPSSMPASSVTPSSQPASSVAPSSSPAASSMPVSSSATPSSEPVSSSANSSNEPTSSAVASSSAPSGDLLSIDFETDTPGSTYAGIGWSSPAVEATVVAISSVSNLAANGSSANVLRVTPLNWNAVPMFELTLPQGKTLADYSFQLDVYFPYASLGLSTSENYYKTLMFFAATTLTGAAEEANGAFQSKRNNGNDNTPAWDEVDKWVTFTLNVDSTKAASLSGTVQIAVGIHRPAGTSADAYYFDNLRLVELP